MVEPRAAPGLITAPISVGDLLDKITILEIKSERIGDPAKLENIRSELDLLRNVWVQRGEPRPGFDKLIDDLKKTNEQLWTIEDEIRDCERDRHFGPRFIELARSVYRTNDHRYELKRRINELAGSGIVEEKSHRAY